MAEPEEMQRFDALLEAMLTKPEPVVPAEPDAASEDHDEM